MICIIFRRVCFDRAPFSPAAATLLLSALWHGFYPSYYFMFIVISSALVVGRKLRKTVRPYFLSSRGLKLFYDVLTVVVTRTLIDFTLLVKNLLLLEHALLYWR
jgi:lysophospholipid acyltransferase 1/2